MTLREMLGPSAGALKERLDEVLDREDAIVILVDRTGTTAYYHGFGASGCQLELASGRVDAALGEIVGAPVRAPRGSRSGEKELIAG